GTRAEPHDSPHDGTAWRTGQRGHDTGLGVNGPPPVDRLVDERRGGGPEDAHGGGKLLRTWAAELSHEQVPAEDELEEKPHGDPGVPLPPHPPGLSRPKRAAHDAKEREDDDQFSRGGTDAIGSGAALEE